MNESGTQNESKRNPNLKSIFLSYLRYKRAHMHKLIFATLQGKLDMSYNRSTIFVIKKKIPKVVIESFIPVTQKIKYEIKKYNTFG